VTAHPAPTRSPRRPASGTGRWPGALSALAEPNFRIFAIGQFASTTAVWAQRVAQDWLVLKLTGNVSAVGITVAMQFLPVLLLGLHAGVHVDRHSRRPLIAATQTVFCAVAAVLAILALTGAVQPWHVYALACVVGVASAIDQPARQVFVNELVPPKALRSAISINQAVFQLGGIAGPATVGWLIESWSIGWAFAASAVAAFASSALILATDKSRLRSIPKATRASGQIAGALTYILKTPNVFWTLVLVAFVSTLGLNWPVLFAAVANHTYNSGAPGYALYNTSLAAGALFGAAASLKRKSVRLRTVAIAMTGFTTLKLLSGLLPTEPLFISAVAAAGALSILMWTAANTLLQTSSAPTLRGRIMAVYLLIAVGGQALGGPVLGWICDNWGGKQGIIISAAAPLSATLAVAATLWLRNRPPRHPTAPTTGSSSIPEPEAQASAGEKPTV
jgi:MFS family permease